VSLVADPMQSTPPEWPVVGRPLSAVPDDRPTVTTQEVQAASEGVVSDDRIEFLGAYFRLADNIGMMPLLAFANAQKEGLDSEDMDGMAAMYSLIRDTIDQTREQAKDADGKPAFDSVGEPIWAGPSDWQRFEKHAIAEKADGEELMDFIGKAMGKISARPRKPRGTSSESSRRTSEKSKESSSSPAIPAQALGLTAVKDLR
jgi:hypothetical protein